MKQAIQKETSFLLKNSVFKCIPLPSVLSECKIQPLKSVLQRTKRNLMNPEKIRHLTRFVSASNLSSFGHSLAGNAFTISLRTIRTMFSVDSIWQQQLSKNCDSLTIRVRDVTKAYLQ